MDPLQRYKSQAIAAVFGINLVFGVSIALLYPGMTDPATAQPAIANMRGSALNWIYQLAILIACFLWLGIDSRQLEIRRPWWLNVGIVVLTSVFVPYYLYKTRPEGQRMQPILNFFGIVFGGALAMMLGMFLALTMATAPVSQAPSL
ncbi:MAG: hypothetical protein ABI650_09590 [Dokdonella sp.]